MVMKPYAPNLTKICNNAVEQWGHISQLMKTIEELSELIKAICKADNLDDIAEETADVEIMLEQLKIMLTCRSEVESWKEYKLERLEQKIEEAKKECLNH